MHRTPEPDLMDDPEQARQYAEADFSAPHDAFVELVRDRFPALRGRVADLGCGAADVSIRFARAHPDALVVGMDGAGTMLDLGTAAVARAGLGDRVRLELRYLPDPTLDAATFDAVISNSLLHHLAEPAALWETIGRIARPGAAIAVMDLRRPPDAGAAAALCERYAGSEGELLRRDFLHSLHAAYEPDEVSAQLDAAGLRLEVTPVGDRHLLVSGRR